MKSLVSTFGGFSNYSSAVREAFPPRNGLYVQIFGMPHPWTGPPQMGGRSGKCGHGPEGTKWCVGKRGGGLQGSRGGHRRFSCEDPQWISSCSGLTQEAFCPLPPCDTGRDLFYSMGMQVTHGARGFGKQYKRVMLGERGVRTFQTPDGTVGSEPGFPEGLVELPH